ncbi:MAG: DNA polymerase III subunit delta' C-terminal domain-containing protein, partial [Burkholderiales bacterium]|nr:DNA polymerase III subunit delta' C-terminal domain-containing protein [Burkholderiales bacterium]
IKSRCQHIALPAPTHQSALAWLKAQGSAKPELGLAQTGNSPLAALKIDTDEYWKQREGFFRGIAGPNFDPLDVAEQLRDTPIPNLLNWLQKWSYDLISLKYLGALRYNPDQQVVLAAAAARIDVLAAMRFHRDVVRLQRIVNHPLNARLFIERLLIECAELVHPAVVR